jgi:hypothetical protein
LTKRTPREERIMAIHQAITSQVRQMEMDWPRSKLTDPMLTGDKHILLKTRVYDTDCVKQGATIIEAMFVDADGFAALFELAAKKKWAFDSCVLLARQELAAKDEQEAA